MVAAPPLFFSFNRNRKVKKKNKKESNMNFHVYIFNHCNLRAWNKFCLTTIKYATLKTIGGKTGATFPNRILWCNFFFPVECGVTRKQVLPFFPIGKIQVQGLAHIRLPVFRTEKVLAVIQRWWTGWCCKLCPVASYTKAFIYVESPGLKELNQGQSSEYGHKYKVQQL